MTDVVDRAENRYLVVHDYGMGALWWWIWAASPEEIVQTLAEVEVVTDEQTIQQSLTDLLEEVHLDSLPEGPLSDLFEQRSAQRSHPDFGKLAGRERVYLRDDSEDHEGCVFLIEVGPDGRALRQVEQTPEGEAIRSTDFTSNAPLDLHDPQYASWEIGQDVFEDAWRTAQPDPDE